MARYILIYKSDKASDWSKLSAPEVKQVVTAWTEWISSIGAALKDGTAFEFGGKSVTKHGADDADNLFTGYAEIDVPSLEEAISIAQRSPNVQASTGTIQLYKALEQ